MKKSVREVWKDRQKIAEGIKNSIIKDEQVEEIAAARDAICQKCEFIDREGSKCFVPGTAPCCGVCGCTLKLLQRSLSSSCEKGKWEQIKS